MHWLTANLAIEDWACDIAFHASPSHSALATVRRSPAGGAPARSIFLIASAMAVALHCRVTIVYTNTELLSGKAE